MTRTQGDQILVKPSSNVYTVLTVVGIIVEVLALIYVYQTHTELYKSGLFGGETQTTVNSSR